jgi:hypothetical protein
MTQKLQILAPLTVGLSTSTPRPMLLASSFSKSSVGCAGLPDEESNGDAGLRTTPETWQMRYKAVQIGYNFGRDTCFHLYCLQNFTADYFSEQAKPEGSFFSLLSTSCTFLRTWLKLPQDYGILTPQIVQFSTGVPPHEQFVNRATGLQPDDGVGGLLLGGHFSGICRNVTERAKL